MLPAVVSAGGLEDKTGREWKGEQYILSWVHMEVQSGGSARFSRKTGYKMIVCCCKFAVKILIKISQHIHLLAYIWHRFSIVFFCIILTSLVNVQNWWRLSTLHTLVDECVHLCRSCLQIMPADNAAGVAHWRWRDKQWSPRLYARCLPLPTFQLTASYMSALILLLLIITRGQSK